MVPGSRTSVRHRGHHRTGSVRFIEPPSRRLLRALLGRITPRLSCARNLERSGGYSASAAGVVRRYPSLFRMSSSCLFAARHELNEIPHCDVRRLFCRKICGSDSPYFNPFEGERNESFVCLGGQFLMEAVTVNFDDECEPFVDNNEV